MYPVGTKVVIRDEKYGRFIGKVIGHHGEWHTVEYKSGNTVVKLGFTSADLEIYSKENDN